MTSEWIVALVLGTQLISLAGILVSFWIWSRYYGEDEEGSVRTTWGRKLPPPPDMKDTEVR